MRTRSDPSGTFSRASQPFSSEDASISGVWGGIDLDIGNSASDCTCIHGFTSLAERACGLRRDDDAHPPVAARLVTIKSRTARRSAPWRGDDPDNIDGMDASRMEVVWNSKPTPILRDG